MERYPDPFFHTTTKKNGKKQSGYARLSIYHMKQNLDKRKYWQLTLKEIWQIKYKILTKLWLVIHLLFSWQKWSYLMSKLPRQISSYITLLHVQCNCHFVKMASSQRTVLYLLRIVRKNKYVIMNEKPRNTSMEWITPWK